MNVFERLRRWWQQQDASDAAPPPDRTLLDAARLAQAEERYADALDLLETLAQRAQRQHDSTLQARVDLNRADVLLLTERYTEADHLLQALRDRAAETGQRTLDAYALCLMGVLAVQRAQTEAARAAFEEARTIAHSVSATGAQGRAMGHLAALYLREHNAHYALFLLEKALPLLETSGDDDLLSDFTGLQGEACLLMGQLERGQAAFERALALAEAKRQGRLIRHWTRRLDALRASSSPSQEGG